MIAGWPNTESSSILVLKNGKGALIPLNFTIWWWNYMNGPT